MKPLPAILTTFWKGADLSSLPEVEECGGRFYDAEKPSDPVISTEGRNPM
jgi:arabinogalactan endo-1,4-beta-galactosidase